MHVKFYNPESCSYFDTKASINEAINSGYINYLLKNVPDLIFEAKIDGISLPIQNIKKRKRGKKRSGVQDSSTASPERRAKYKGKTPVDRSSVVCRYVRTIVETRNPQPQK